MHLLNESDHSELSEIKYSFNLPYMHLYLVHRVGVGEVLIVATASAIIRIHPGEYVSRILFAIEQKQDLLCPHLKNTKVTVNIF